MKPNLGLVMSMCALSFCCFAAEEKVIYQNDFEKAEVGKVPADFLVLDGGFTVKEESGNKFLELPGSPLDTYAVQFGPTESANTAVSARINATAKGRRYPVFGIGLNGVAGYKLQVSPAKDVLEILKDQAIKASVAFSWKSGAWTNLRLQVRKLKDGGYKIEGKAWPHGIPEPASWMITFDETEEPIAGRASVSGSPFSGTKIQFDDFVVARVPAQN